MEKLAFYPDHGNVCYYLYFDDKYSLLETYQLDQIESVPDDIPKDWVNEAYELPEKLVGLNDFIEKIQEQFSEDKIAAFYTRQYPEDVHTTWKKSLGPTMDHSVSLGPQKLTRRNTKVKP